MPQATTATVTSMHTAKMPRGHSRTHRPKPTTRPSSAPPPNPTLFSNASGCLPASTGPDSVFMGNGREFIPRKRSARYLNDAVQREAEAFIEVSQSLAVRDAVQAKVRTSKLSSARSGIGEQLGRNPLLRPRPPYGELVDEGRAARQNLGP